jgi:amino acid adenylation domain-containing protein
MPPTGSISYSELVRLSDRVRDRLAALGVRRGDRVGIYLPKSIDSLASLFGAMKAGAAYVPVDASGPAWRAAYVLTDCTVRACVIERRLLDEFAAEVGKLGAVMPQVVVVDHAHDGTGLLAALDAADRASHAGVVETIASAPTDLAYILYTSGSTGKPKGVMLTHENALSFVDWCSSTFAPRPDDRFSSHAPFHFDLSILDIYLPLKHGATLVLIGNDAGKEPLGLATLIAERRLTIWYSAPSILSMLAQFGKMERNDYSALRIVLFAGEVFPIKHLQLLKSIWTHPRYFNLYGPTETNVCTYFEVPATVPAERKDPYPIGKVCENLRGRVVDEQQRPMARDAEGELVITGPNVMQGYWNLPERTAQSFVVDPDGTRWYRTGDIVTLDERDDYVFVGRRDRMVKRRGNRVELGEVEAGLYRHPSLRDVAVIAIKSEDGVRIRAFYTSKTTAPPSVIELKRFCVENLPAAMIPDEFVLQENLPKTSTDKIDYQRLQGMT